MWIMDDGDNKGILAINGQRGDPYRGRQDPGFRTVDIRYIHVRETARLGVPVQFLSGLVIQVQLQNDN
jgi:hypothetical protein